MPAVTGRGYRHRVIHHLLAFRYSLFSGLQIPMPDTSLIQHAFSIYHSLSSASDVWTGRERTRVFFCVHIVLASFAWLIAKCCYVLHRRIQQAILEGIDPLPNSLFSFQPISSLLQFTSLLPPPLQPYSFSSQPIYSIPFILSFFSIPYPEYI